MILWTDIPQIPTVWQLALARAYFFRKSCLSEIGGNEALADPNREIGFGFVSCSCRACVRAGEAKLRERVGSVLLNAGGSNGHIGPSDSGGGFSFDSFCCYQQSDFWHITFYLHGF